MNELPHLKSINDLPEFTPKDSVKKTRKRSGFLIVKIFLVFFIVIAAFGSIFSYRVLSVGKDVFVKFNSEKSSFFDQINKLVLSQDKQLVGQEEGRTNILLLGMGGEGHSGALLTDTIMLASIKYDENSSDHKVSLLSIPRDLYAPVSTNRSSKINSIYSIGERQEENGGAELISKTVSKITGLPIHYYVRVDFEGFKNVVDSLGGIEVDVERGFIDKEYPTYNFGYQTVEFKKGPQEMDGETALQYARSRHGVVTDGEGYEGSDFARAKRQQKILESVREKVFSVSTIVNPKKLNDLLGALGDHARTNVEPWEMMAMLELAREINRDSIVNEVLEHGDSGLLYSSNVNGAYVLLPKEADFSEVKKFAQDIFENNDDIITEKIPPLNVYVLNGTTIPGLASLTQKSLDKQGYEVLGVGNASATNYSQTIIYSVNNSQPEKIKELQNELKARSEQKNVSELQELSDVVIPSTVDIVVILGQNAS